MATKIYVLLSPENEIRYVGKTKNSLSSRFMGHLSEARKGSNGYRCNWIRSLLKIGKLPSIQLIGEVDGDGCREEIAWISYFNEDGVSLTNNTLGGDGASRDFTSSETRQKISQTLMGHKLSDETKNKISTTLKKNPTRYWLGKTRLFSEQHCKNMSLSSQGHVGWNKGKITPDETRKKISIALMGRPHGPVSEETKTKISIAQKARLRKINP